MLHWLHVRIQALLPLKNTKALGVSCISLLVCMSLLLWLNKGYQQQLITNQKNQVEAQLQSYATTLNLIINQGFARLTGLAAFIQINPSPDRIANEFPAFASGLGSEQWIRNIGIAPQGIIQQVYPFSGNESAIGLDLINDTASRSDVRRAIESRKITLTDPFELIQGGQALVARLAIYHQGSLWGLASIVLDIQGLIDEAGLAHLAPDLNIVLKDGSGKTFYHIGGSLSDLPVYHRILLPDGPWSLAATPATGWKASIHNQLILFQSAGVIIAILITLLTYLTVNRQTSLARAVKKQSETLTRANNELQQEIIERQTAEEALIESKAKYNGIIASAMDAIVTLDANLNIILFNKAAENMFQYSADDIIGQTIFTLVPKRFHRKFNYLLKQDSFRGGHMADYYALRANGEEFPLEASLARTRIKGQNLFTAIIRDTSSRKVLEEQIIQSRKTDALGRLAGGIAHDFNNLLGPITGFCALAIKDLPPESPHSSNLTMALEAAERASALTQQILAFSRNQVMETSNINLNSIINGFNKMLGTLTGPNIETFRYLDANLPLIDGDKNKIEQILMNFALNARDAMHEGGVLTLETSSVTINSNSPHDYQEFTPGSYVALTITDTGHGIDEETRKHIFDPFFTTKKQGLGTGLGLATIHGIIKQHHGHIHISSEVGSFTTFTLFFPETKKTPQTDITLPLKKQYPKKAATILIVEDEELMLKFVCLTLESLGYQVLHANSPEQGLSLAISFTGHIDLLLTDVMMPEMNGRELYRKVLAARPDINVLYMSGYADDILSEEGVLSEGANYLQKPFSPNKLDRKISAVLA